MSAAKITCLFYSEATIARFLNSSGGQSLCGNLIIEIATFPSLAYALNLETPANHPGIAGLIGNMSLNDLTVESPNLPVPAVLAPGSSVGIPALRAALAELKSKSGDYENITLLVPTTDAESVGASLGVADEFSIAWDATALPSPDIVQFAEWLRDEGLTDEDSFGGVYSYTPGLLDATAASHVQKLGTLLNSFADKNSAIQRDVAIASD